MNPATATFFVLYGLIAIAYVVISIVFFYHIGRYSYLGDASKRIFLLYTMFGVSIITVTFIFMILNHIVS